MRLGCQMLVASGWSLLLGVWRSPQCQIGMVLRLPQCYPGVIRRGLFSCAWGMIAMRGRTVGRAAALGMAGVPVGGVAGSAPAVWYIAP